MEANTLFLYQITVLRPDGSVGNMEIYARSEAAAKSAVSDRLPFTILGAQAVNA